MTYKRWRFDRKNIIYCVLINNVFKTESIRKLSNFNFQWTKTMYQNNLNNITFFFTFFEGYRCNKLSLIITPKKFIMGATENECQISRRDILHMKFSEFYLCFHNSCEI